MSRRPLCPACRRRISSSPRRAEGRARRGRPAMSAARWRRSAPCPRPTCPTGSCTCPGFSSRRSPATFATWPWNLPSLDERGAESRRERVGEPEAGIVPRGRVLAARVAEPRDETDRLAWTQVRSSATVFTADRRMCGRSKVVARQWPPPVRPCNKKARRDAARRALVPETAATAYFFFSSFPGSFFSAPFASAAGLPSAAGAAAPAAAGGCRRFGLRRDFDDFLDVRLRHHRRGDHRVERAAGHHRDAGRKLQRRDVDRVADVERREVDLDELRAGPSAGR